MTDARTADRIARRRRRVLNALQDAADDGQQINVSAIAARAGVPRAFLYRQRDLLDQIRAAQAQPPLHLLLTWMSGHLREPLDVPSIAHQASMSERTLARRFQAETGTTPHAWIIQQRLRRAQQLLETTDLSVPLIAAQAGFGSAGRMRHHFAATHGISPLEYRRRHRDQSGPSAQTARVSQLCSSAASPLRSSVAGGREGSG